MAGCAGSVRGSGEGGGGGGRLVLEVGKWHLSMGELVVLAPVLVLVLVLERFQLKELGCVGELSVQVRCAGWLGGDEASSTSAMLGQMASADTMLGGLGNSAAFKVTGGAIPEAGCHKVWLMLSKKCLTYAHRNKGVCLHFWLWASHIGRCSLTVSMQPNIHQCVNTGINHNHTLPLVMAPNTRTVLLHWRLWR
jgi:hypothetical protein